MVEQLRKAASDALSNNDRLELWTPQPHSLDQRLHIFAKKEHVEKDNWNLWMSDEAQKLLVHIEDNVPNVELTYSATHVPGENDVFCGFKIDILNPNLSRLLED